MVLLIGLIILLVGSAWLSLLEDQHKYYGGSRGTKKDKRFEKNQGDWELTSVNVYTREMIKISWDQYFTQSY